MNQKHFHVFSSPPRLLLRSTSRVIGEKAITEKGHCLLLAVLTEFCQGGGAVLLVCKEGLAVIASGDDVIDSSEIFNSQGPSHGRQLSPQIHLFKPDPNYSLGSEKRFCIIALGLRNPADSWPL